MSDPLLEAVALATRILACPSCGMEVCAPESTSILETECHDCGMTLRLCPCGEVRAVPERREPPCACCGGRG